MFTPPPCASVPIRTVTTGHGPSGPYERVLFHATRYGVDAEAKEIDEERRYVTDSLRMFAPVVKRDPEDNVDAGDTGVSIKTTSTEQRKRRVEQDEWDSLFTVCSLRAYTTRS